MQHRSQNLGLLLIEPTFRTIIFATCILQGYNLTVNAQVQHNNLRMIKLALQNHKFSNSPGNRKPTYFLLMLQLHCLSFFCQVCAQFQKSWINTLTYAKGPWVMLTNHGGRGFIQVTKLQNIHASERNRHHGGWRVQSVHHSPQQSSIELLHVKINYIHLQFAKTVSK